MTRETSPKKKSPRRHLRIYRILASTLGMGLVLLAFLGAFPRLAGLLHLQFGPAALNALGLFATGTAGFLGAFCTVAILLLLTWLFGRFYCVLLCPLGIFQDFVGWLSRRKTPPPYNLPWLRYLLAGFAWTTALCGWSVAFLAFDPYSLFGRFLRPFSLGAIAPLVVLLLLAIWKKRLFCTSLCPVGTLLGLCAKIGFFRLTIDQRCVQCGKCASLCPAGCLDPKSRLLDNERCVRCLNCLSECPIGSIRFQPLWKRSPKKEAGNPPPAPKENSSSPLPDLSRRRFLRQGGIFLAGCLAGLAFTRTALQNAVAKARSSLGILPPGAGDAGRFARTCTACQLCVHNCPQHILRPAPGGYGPVRLDLSQGYCDFDCHRCSQICPTGAILPLSLETKRKTKIAVASFTPQHCLVFQEGQPCGRCHEACPTGAIALRKTGAPRPVKTDLCIGCGKCQFVCPATPKAMTVAPLENHS